MRHWATVAVLYIAMLGLTSSALAATAYVAADGNDATAELNRPDAPFLTIDAALGALPDDGGKVSIGIGTFPAPDRESLRDHVTLEGTQRPAVNSARRGLEAGTILLGPLRGSASHLRIANLGVDSGPDVTDILHGGAAIEGIQITSRSAVLTNIVVEDVTVICRDPQARVHGIALASVTRSSIRDVETWFGVHGVALKGTASTIRGVKAHGHGFDGVILKSNAVGSAGLSQFAEGINISDVIIRGVELYDSGGLQIQSSGGVALRNTNISNVYVSGARYGVKFVSSDHPDNRIETVQMQNIVIENVLTSGFIITREATDVVLSNISVKESQRIPYRIEAAEGEVWSSNCRPPLDL